MERKGHSKKQRRRVKRGREMKGEGRGGKECRRRKEGERSLAHKFTIHLGSVSQDAVQLVSEDDGR